MSRPENFILYSPVNTHIKLIESLPDSDEIYKYAYRGDRYINIDHEKSQHYYLKAWLMMGIEPYQNKNKKRYRSWELIRESVHPKGWGDSMTDY